MCPSCTRDTDGIAAKLLRCGIASEALRRNMPLSWRRVLLQAASSLEVASPSIFDLPQGFPLDDGSLELACVIRCGHRKKGLLEKGSCQKGQRLCRDFRDFSPQSLENNNCLEILETLESLRNSGDHFDEKTTSVITRFPSEDTDQRPASTSTELSLYNGSIFHETGRPIKSSSALTWDFVFHPGLSCYYVAGTTRTQIDVFSSGVCFSTCQLVLHLASVPFSDSSILNAS